MEKSEFIEERNKKLDSLKEECDFVTIEYSFPDDIYICHKSPSRIKGNQPSDQTEETCLLYTSPSPRDAIPSRMPSSA